MERVAPSLAIGRRELLAGLALAGLVPGRILAAASPFEALLDRTAAAREPETMLAVLRGADARALDKADAAILAMVTEGVADELALRRAFPWGRPDGGSPYVLSHRHGAWLDLAGGKGDPAALAQRLDKETKRLEAAASAGIVPPLFVLEKVIESEKAQLSSAPPAVRRALTAQIDAVTALRSRAPTAGGVWAVAHGPDYYALRLRCATGSALAPLALDREVRAATARLLTRADRLFRRIGLAKGNAGSRYRALKHRPADIYANDGAGRDRAVADMNAALARLRPHMADWFDPPLELGSHVARLSPADEAAGKRGYRDAPADGRPGTYFPDLSSPADRPRWTLVTVAHHETIPGHMLQFRRQALAAPHPLQVKYAAGYAEGWAIYAESLVDRMSLLSPVEQLGFIQSVLFRLARVTADIGLHVHRWSREKALRYLQDTVGFELFFGFDVEVDRYCVEPAGFAGDAHVAITLMRMAARHPAGADIRGFHEKVLGRGPMSATALEAVAS